MDAGRNYYIYSSGIGWRCNMEGLIGMVMA
jgi:hypothetical protein